MNQAQSRRLRMRCLLLLAPLLVAGTPSPLPRSLPISIVLTPTASIVFSRPPPSATAGQPVNVTVEARDALGFVAAGYSGTIEFTSTDTRAVLPQRYTFSPSTDQGRKVFPVTFQSGGIWELVAQDVANPNFRASAPGIRVQAAAAVRLEIEGLAWRTFPGRPLTFRVEGLDANGNPGSVDGLLDFEASDPEAVIPDNGRPLQPSYTVTFYAPGEQTLTVWVRGSDPLLSFTASIVVDDIEPREVELSASVPRVPTCGTVLLTMEVGDPVAPVAVTLCRPGNRSATIVRTEGIEDLVTTEQCITGSIGLLERTGTVEWKNEVGEDVEFKLYGTQTGRTVMVSWVPEPKPENTSFLFLNTIASIPKLAVSTGERTLQLNMSDTCPKPLVLPPDKQPVFRATPPLSITPLPASPST